MEASITLKNVSKKYNNRYVLSNLTLGVEKGSAFAIVGRNGAGKSVLMRILSTLMKPDGGTIFIKGQEVIGSGDEQRQSIGYLPDHDLHDPWITGRENLALRGHHLGLSESATAELVNGLARDFGMETILDECPVEYSRGSKRCLDIMMILLSDPEIILLDEPSLGLDYYLRAVFFKKLALLKGQKTIVMASNHFSEIQTLADRWVVLHEGIIRFDGTLEKIVTQIGMPFIGNIEFKAGGYQLIKSLQHSKGVREIRDLGKTIQIVTDDIEEFTRVLKKIDNEHIVGISGNSINMEEFLNQLISDEGLL